MNSTDPGGRFVLAVLSKAPVPGQVKTRLIPELGAERAATLQDWLLRRSVATALEADIGPVTLWCAPDLLHPAFQRYQHTSNISLHRQPAGDLGHRIFSALASAPPNQGVLIIGTDCPTLTAEMIRQAAAELAGNDAVLIPAEDGGYVLIGMKTTSERPFTEIDWGTDQVARQTRAAFSQMGWRWAEPRTLWDVDRFADFQRLCILAPEIGSLAPPI